MAEEKAPAVATGLVRSTASGVPMAGGRFYYDEPREVSDLATRMETYRRMATSDAYIWETVQQNTLPLLGSAVWKATTWDADTADDKQKKMAALANAVVLNQPSKDFPMRFCQSVPFKQSLTEILQFLTNGFAVFHLQPKMVDGKRVLDRMLFLEPNSVTKWDVNKSDKLLGIERSYQRPDGKWESMEYLPVEEIALFVWNPIGTRLEGMSMLRPMFGPWRRKEFLHRCKMIAAQRASVGIPFAKRDPSEDGEETKATTEIIEKFLQSLLGPGLDFGYLASTNKTLEIDFITQSPADFAKFDGMVFDENMAFAHAGSTKASMLGETVSGARSVGAVQQTVQYVMIEAIAQIIAEQMVFGFGNVKGPIQTICDWNYTGFDFYPKVKVTGVDPAEPQRNIPLLIDSAKAGLIRKTKPIEKYILQACGLDLTDKEIEEAEELPPSAVEQANIESLKTRAQDPGATPPNGPGQPKKPSAKAPSAALPGSSAKNDPARASLARRTAVRASVSDWLRIPTWDPPQSKAATGQRSPSIFEERCLALGHIATELADGVTHIGVSITKAWRAILTDITGRARAGKLEPGMLDGLRRSGPKGAGALKVGIRDAFISVAESGRRQSLDELRRQKTMSVYATEGDDDIPVVIPPGGEIPVSAASAAALAAIIDEFGWSQIALYDALTGEAIVTANLTIDAMWQRALTEAINEANRLTRAGYSGAELEKRLEAFLMSLSDKPMTAAARQVASVAYNEGRDVTGKLAATSGEATYAMRSEVLDAKTCSSCAGIDGTIYLIGSEEYEQNMPPAGCAGGDLCRGFMVYLSNRFTDQKNEVLQ